MKLSPFALCSTLVALATMVLFGGCTKYDQDGALVQFRKPEKRILGTWTSASVTEPSFSPASAFSMSSKVAPLALLLASSPGATGLLVACVLLRSIAPRQALRSVASRCVHVYVRARAHAHGEDHDHWVDVFEYYLPR